MYGIDEILVRPPCRGRGSCELHASPRQYNLLTNAVAGLRHG